MQLHQVIPEPTLEQLRDDYRAVRDAAHRSSIPTVRRCSDIGFSTIRERAPRIAALYRSSELVNFVSRLVGRRVELKTDEHACAVYAYTVPGDFMHYHYDTCGCEQGASYTVNLSLIDQSSMRFRAKLFKRYWTQRTRYLELATAPGSMLVYCGSNIYHSVSKLRRDEERVIVSMTYVAEGKQGRGLTRLKERVKDSALYFGLPSLVRRLRR